MQIELEDTQKDIITYPSWTFKYKEEAIEKLEELEKEHETLVLAGRTR